MRLENYFIKGQKVVRELKVAGKNWHTAVDYLAEQRTDPDAAWWQSFLRGALIHPEESAATLPPIRSVDAFCGCGGLTLGAVLAATAVGRRLESIAAIDVDADGLQVHQANFGTKQILHGNASSLVDFHVNGSGESSHFAYDPEIIAQSLTSEVGKIDLLLAGPPCQGHSNLNNKTRRDDPRNLLYLTAVAIAVGLRARFVAIENVPEVVNGKHDVVNTGKALLHSAGYKFIDSGILATDELGGAQTRKRFFLIAARDEAGPDALTIEAIAKGMNRDARSLEWAIGDLLEIDERSQKRGVMDTVPALSEENRARIKYLFEHDLYELPNHERPNCHKDGHTYPSVYGRLRWEKPSQTITTGFLTPGRGRYIHPIRPRVITPREAARIQSFPDSFRFVVNGHDPARNALSKWIGDAVPPLLGYAAILPLLTRL